MKSILLILPYFGKWPIWFEAYLVSIDANPTINWLIVTDCVIPENYPKNIKFVTTTLAELNSKVNEVVQVNVPLTPRKFCDLKPAYGAIFSEYIQAYDFWGFCDMDIIWGDIRKFITDSVLENYDIISSRKNAISGHFNLFRNTDTLCYLYQKVPNYKELFSKEPFMWFDEEHLTNYLQEQLVLPDFSLKVYWPTILLNQERGIDSWQGYYLDNWLWKNGQLLNIQKSEEIMYLHFISWKRKMKYCKVKYNNAEKFYISFDGIKSGKHSRVQININSLLNKIYGFWFREKVKATIKKYKKRVNRKFRIT